MNASAPMPQYQCHKKVWALKIAGLVEVEGVMMMTPAEKHFAPSALSADYVAKHRPHVGGYYVVYEDGYKSFSPAKAFEDGYALVRAHDASAQAAEITALRARVAGLEGALTELTELFDDDGYLNVVGDYQREVVAAARAALSPSAAQEARDAD